ncbi:hypothetical protein [Herbaspirillum aquaticum]|uniref:XRE family transcriptional regulator n=1 Tax=Herbaspirillum aquaticum TaxID=568783 RepID=A0A225SZR0_9BURK|nr:hypothetical protein [Herbaspirillum aquaticum]OWY35287.1 hypothetical protein CEJ45_08420 [Herbaspirillum aquaticum]
MIKVKVPVLAPIDWFQLLLDIQRRGYTLQTLAAAVDIPRTTLIGWRDLDATPRHPDGERVIALWCQVTGQNRDQIPRIARF